MSDLLAQAVELMILGMTFVFLFLTILVFATGYMSKLVLRFAPDVKPIETKKVQSPGNISASNDEQLLAVLSAAVAKYRSDQKK